jgi:hypothetical protein
VIAYGDQAIATPPAAAEEERDMPLDAAHVHLMLNHLPVIGAPLLLLLLTIGLLRGSRELVTVSLVLVVGLAVATGLVYLTGEPAEELVKHTPWFHNTLAERHEEHATVSLAAVLVTGLLASAALALRHRPRAGVWLPRATWGGLALSTVLLGWTGWSGGQIRHEEVRAAAVIRQSDPGDGGLRMSLANSMRGQCSRPVDLAAARRS